RPSPSRGRCRLGWVRGGGGTTSVKWLCSLLLAAAPASRAQPTPPAPAVNEDPGDVAARVRYERAVRADFDGRRDDAVREAKACLEVKPDGRFADASRALIQRIETGAPGAHLEAPAPVRSTGVGPRTELVIS